MSETQAAQTTPPDIDTLIGLGAAGKLAPSAATSAQPSDIDALIAQGAQGKLLKPTAAMKPTPQKTAPPNAPPSAPISSGARIGVGVSRGLGGQAAILGGSPRPLAEGQAPWASNSFMDTDQPSPISQQDVAANVSRGLTHVGLPDPAQAPPATTTGQKSLERLGEGLSTLPMAIAGPGGIAGAAGRGAAIMLGGQAGNLAAQSDYIPDAWKPIADMIANMGVAAGTPAAVAGGRGAINAYQTQRGRLGMGQKQTIPIPGGGSFSATPAQIDQVRQRLMATGGKPLADLLQSQQYGPLFQGDQPTLAELAHRESLSTAGDLSVGENAARQTYPAMFNQQGRDQNAEAINALKSTASPTADPNAVSQLFQEQTAEARAANAAKSEQLGQGVEAATQPLRPEVHPEQIGSTVRNEGLAPAQHAEKAAQSALWEAYNPDVQISTGPATQVAQGIWDQSANRYTPKLAAPVVDVLRRILGSKALGESEAGSLPGPMPDSINFQQSKGILSTISEAQRAVEPGSVAMQQLQSIKQAFMKEMETAAPEYAQMRSAYAAYKDKWSTGPLGAVMARARGAAASPYTVTDSAVMNQFKTSEGVQQLIDVIGDRPEVMDAVKTHFLAELQSKKIIQPDGQMGLKAFNEWRRARADILEKFPDLKPAFDNAVAAQESYNNGVASIKARADAYGDKVATQMIEGDPAKAVRTAMTGPDGPRQLTVLIQRIKSMGNAIDPRTSAALASLQRHVTDYIIDKFTSGAALEGTPDAESVSLGALRARQYNDFLTDYRVPFKQLYGDPFVGTGGGQGYNNLFQVGKMLRNRQEAAASAVAVPGSPTSAYQQNLGKAGMSNQPQHSTGVSQLVAGVIGEHVTEHLTGIGTIGLVGGVVVKSWINALRQAGVQTKNDLTALAYRYPEVAKVLAERVPNGQPISAGLGRRVAMAITAATMSDIVRQTGAQK